MKVILKLTLLGGVTLGCGESSGPSAPPAPPSKVAEDNKGESSADATKDKDQQPPFTAQVIDNVSTPPREYFDAVFKQDQTAADKKGGLSLGSGAPTIYINFAGGQVAKGYGKGESYLVCSSQADLPKPELSPSDQETIVKQVKSYFTDAGATLTVTKAKPAGGNYTTVHVVGGGIKDLGCSGAEVLGAAPLDSQNINLNDVAFIFSVPLKNNPDLIAKTVAHEAAHTLGLEHVTEKDDLMYAELHSDPSSFKVSPKAGFKGASQDGPAMIKAALAKQTEDKKPTGGATPPSVTPPASGGGGLGGTNPLSNIPGLGNLGGLLGPLAGLIPGLNGGNPVAQPVVVAKNNLAPNYNMNDLTVVEGMVIAELRLLVKDLPTLIRLFRAVIEDIDLQLSEGSERDQLVGLAKDLFSRRFNEISETKP